MFLVNLQTFSLFLHIIKRGFQQQVGLGFFKQEGKTKDHEVLICRLIDRPLHPTMMMGFLLWNSDTFLGSEHHLITSSVWEKNHLFLNLLIAKPAVKTKTSLYHKVFMQVWELDWWWDFGDFGDFLALCSSTKHGDWHI